MMKNRSIRGKRSQMGMIETIAILFIFFFLLVIGAVFYARVSMVSGARESREKQDLEAIQTALKALSLPDLECPTTMHKENCMDMLKLNSISGIMKDNDYYLELYYDTLKFSYITVTQVYPTQGSTWVIYNNANLNGSKIFTHMPVIIHDPIEDIYYLGIMNVSYYSPPVGRS